MSAVWIFDGIENNHDLHGGKDCIKKFFKFLREYAIKIINFKMKKIIPLTNKYYTLKEVIFTEINFYE